MITIYDKETHNFEDVGYSVQKIYIESPFHLDIERVVYGLDPGTVNLGLSMVHRMSNHVYQVTLDRKPLIVERVKQIRSILYQHIDPYRDSIMIIEGAGYGSSQYRQVELAEVRTTAVLWCVDNNIDVEVLAPNAIRKIVFGNGKTKAQDVWKDLPPDAASALACAYSAIMR